MFANFQFLVQDLLLSASAVHQNNSAASSIVPSFRRLTSAVKQSSCFVFQFPSVSSAIRTLIHPLSTRYQELAQARDLNSVKSSQQAQNCAMSL